MTLVGRTETQNKLAPHPHVAVEISCRCPLRSERSQPHNELPSLEHQCQKVASPQHLAMKVSKDSICQGETEGCWESRHTLTVLIERKN